MGALTLERLTNFAGLVPTRGTYGLKANTRVFKGGMAGLDSAGRLMPAGTLASGVVSVMGKCSSTIDNRTGSELGGAADAADGDVEFGTFGWENSGGGDAITNAHAGEPCYAVDDQTVALTSNSGTRPYAGIVTEVRGGKVYVWQSPVAFPIAEASELAEAGVSLQKRSVTVGHADLTDADTQQDISIGAALPANARILGVAFHTVTAFSGGTVSALTADIGSSGDPDALIDGANLFAAAVDGQAATRPLGIAPNKLFAGATQLVARFDSVGDNLVNLTAGAVTIDVLFAVLP